MASTINAKNTSTGVVITPDASGQLELQTADTTRMTIDVNGNVGVGTTTNLGFKLDLYGVQPQFAIRGNASNGSQLVFYSNNSTSNSTRALIGQGYDSASDNVFYISNQANADMVLRTNATERMRIDSSGNLLVNYSSLPTNGARLSVAGDIAAGSGFKTKAGSAAGLGGNAFNINWTGSAQLWIDVTNIGTIAFTSDYRIKKNIETNLTPALDRIQQLRPVTYEYANYGELFKEDGVQREGFIAHELAEIIPSAVEGEKDAEDQIQSLKLDALCSVMVKAIQELKAELDTVKAELAELKGTA